MTRQLFFALLLTITVIACCSTFSCANDTAQVETLGATSNRNLRDSNDPKSIDADNEERVSEFLKKIKIRGPKVKLPSTQALPKVPSKQSSKSLKDIGATIAHEPAVAKAAGEFQKNPTKGKFRNLFKSVKLKVFGTKDSGKRVAAWGVGALTGFLSLIGVVLYFHYKK